MCELCMFLQIQSYIAIHGKYLGGPWLTWESGLDIETLAKSFNADQLVAGQKKGSILERTASTD